MKVICVETQLKSVRCDNSYYPNLTIGKEYECLNSNVDYANYYMVRNDNNTNIMCPKHFFITKEEYRNKRLEEIGI